jgi:hypothetical protein
LKTTSMEIRFYPDLCFIPLILVLHFGFEWKQKQKNITIYRMEALKLSFIKRNSIF